MPSSSEQKTQFTSQTTRSHSSEEIKLRITFGDKFCRDFSRLHSVLRGPPNIRLDFVYFFLIILCQQYTLQRHLIAPFSLTTCQCFSFRFTSSRQHLFLGGPQYPIFLSSTRPKISQAYTKDKAAVFFLFIFHCRHFHLYS